MLSWRLHYYLYTRQPLPDFQPGYEDNYIIPPGHVLIIRFVRVDGVKHHWDDIIGVSIINHFYICIVM